MSHYVYVESESGLYTVGFSEPSGTWIPESDHETQEAAAERVHYLNSDNPTESEVFAKLMARPWQGNFCQDADLLSDLSAFIDDESQPTGHRYAALRRYTEDVMGIELDNDMPRELAAFVTAGLEEQRDDLNDQIAHM